jgi:hypothetical protein
VVVALELHRSLAKQKIERMRAAASRLHVARRGGNLKTLVLHALGKFDQELQRLDEELAEFERAVEGGKTSDVQVADFYENQSVKYERLHTPLGVVHRVLAKYEGSIDRPDLPVGIQHLIHVLMKQLTRETCDPIVHLDPVDNYSTIDLVAELNEMKRRDGGLDIENGYEKERRPVVLNLPALDPANALLAPLLVHEVAHSAVEAELLGQLKDRTPTQTTALNAAIDEIRSTIGPGAADETAARYLQWCGELICDAVAIAITGPSFLFAFGAFVRPSGVASLSTHPPSRDRLGFHLRVLDRMGWTTSLRDQIPAAYDWFVEASGDLPLAKTQEERILRQGMKAVEDTIIKLSLEAVKQRLLPARAEEILEIVSGELALGTPVVEHAGVALDAWEIVFAGWISVFHQPLDSLDDKVSVRDSEIERQLVSAVGNVGLNALLVKAIELSSIVTAWRQHERTDI